MLGIVNLIEPKFNEDNDYSLENICLQKNENTELLKTGLYTFIYEGTIFEIKDELFVSQQENIDNSYGCFSYLKLDKQKNELVIGTDKLGFSPIYYSLQKGSFIFSTSLSTVKSNIKKITPDYDAWDELLNLGDILGTKTTIKEIKRLDYGTRIRISKNKVYFEKFWNFEVPTLTDKDTYIKENNRLLSEALEKTRDGYTNKVVLMSGGEDSRRIGVAARHIDLPVTFATQEAIHTGDIDDDVLLADEVSRCLGVDLLRVKLASKEEHYMDSQVRDRVLGYETSQHHWLFPMLKKLNKNSLIYDGIAGDITINGHYFREYPELVGILDVEKIADVICRKERNFVFSDSYLTSTLRDRVLAELKKFPKCMHILSYFYLMNHTRRNISLQSQLYSFYEHKTCYPFLYYPLFIQSFSIHPKYYLDNLYQRLCMEKINPAVTEIPTTRSVLDSKYKIDFKKESMSRERYYLNHCQKISKEVKLLFPQQKRNFRLVDIASCGRLLPIPQKIKWFYAPLSRMTSFLDWMNDNS